jgi:hypothetical protein
MCVHTGQEPNAELKPRESDVDRAALRSSRSEIKAGEVPDTQRCGGGLAVVGLGDFLPAGKSLM